MSKLPEKKLDLLIKEEPSKKKKTNVPFYDILANQTYRSLLEYDSFFLEDQCKLEDDFNKSLNILPGDDLKDESSSDEE